VVDDDATIRRSLERLLASAGFTPTSYETPLTFLVAASGRLAGCILLNLWMPGMDGLEVQTRLRQMGVLLPVIVMTAGGGVQTAVPAMKAGTLGGLVEVAGRFSRILKSALSRQGLCSSDPVWRMMTERLTGPHVMAALGRDKLRSKKIDPGSCFASRYHWHNGGWVLEGSGKTGQYLDCRCA
jgi:CheY-like chemotaxis protein